MSFAVLNQPTPSRSFAGRRQASAQPSQASGGKSSGGMPMPGALDPAQRQQIEEQNQMFSGTIGVYNPSMSGAQDLYNQSRPGIDTVDQNLAGQTGQSALQTGAQGLGSAQSFFNQYQNAIFGQQPPPPTISMPAFSTGPDGQRYDTQGNMLPNMPGTDYQQGTSDFVMPGLVQPSRGPATEPAPPNPYSLGQPPTQEQINQYAGEYYKSQGVTIPEMSNQPFQVGIYNHNMIGTTDEPAPVNTMPQIPSDNQGGAAGQPPNPPVNPLLDVLKQYAPAAAPLVQQNIPQPVAQPPRPAVGAPQPSFANRAARTRAPQMQPRLPPPPAQAPRPVSRPGARVRFR